MRVRRSIFHVLLSLLLLVSQQMAISHVMSHWSGVRDHSAQVQQRDGGRGAKPKALDQACHQCLAFAQIAVAVGGSFLAFAATDVASERIASPTTPAACLRAVCFFQSRAPPLA